MNMTQRKYLIERVKFLSNETVYKLKNQVEYEHHITRSTIIKELKNWRPLTKKEILKYYEEHDYRSLDHPIVYDENEFKITRKKIIEQIKTSNKIIQTSVNKIITETAKVTDTIMIGNETEALKVLADFTKFVSKF